MECDNLFSASTTSICSLDLSAKDRDRAPWLADITSPSWTSTLWTLFSYSLHACLKHSNVIFIDTHLNIFLRWDQQPCALSATNLLGWKKETGDRERESADVCKINHYLFWGGGVFLIMSPLKSEQFDLEVVRHLLFGQVFLWSWWTGGKSHSRAAGRGGWEQGIICSGCFGILFVWS